MTDVIWNGLKARPDLTFHRNTNERIADGDWVYKLTRGEEVLVYTMDDDIAAIESFFTEPTPSKQNKSDSAE